jgi:hypothetical protein
VKLAVLQIAQTYKRRIETRFGVLSGTGFFLLFAYSLFAHGCHGNEDTELLVFPLPSQLPAQDLSQP